jgi:hypothetical protein
LGEGGDSKKTHPTRYKPLRSKDKYTNMNEVNLKKAVLIRLKGGGIRLINGIQMVKEIIKRKIKRRA